MTYLILTAFIVRFFVLFLLARPALRGGPRFPFPYNGVALACGVLTMLRAARLSAGVGERREVEAGERRGRAAYSARPFARNDSGRIGRWGESFRSHAAQSAAERLGKTADNDMPA